MKRDLCRLQERKFDIAVVGAGIYGAAIAWDAARRGLSVALIDKGDFGGATSSNSVNIPCAHFTRIKSGTMRRTKKLSQKATNIKICLGSSIFHQVNG